MTKGIEERMLNMLFGVETPVGTAPPSHDQSFYLPVGDETPVGTFMRYVLAPERADEAVQRGNFCGQRPGR